MDKELDSIFDVMTKDIPEVPDISDRIYSKYINEGKKTRSILSKNKFRFVLTSFILVLLIGISIPFITKWIGNPSEEIDKGSIHYGYCLPNNGGIIKMYDCYSNNDNDIFTIYIEELNVDKLIIEESNDKIIKVKIRDNEEVLLSKNNSYVLNTRNVNSIYIDIYFEKALYQTNTYELKKTETNGIITEDYNSGNDLTQVRFNCYTNEILLTNKVEVMYYFSRSRIGNKPLIKANGICNTIQEALTFTDFDYVLASSTLEVQHVTYAYNNQNDYSCIEYQYGVNRNVYTIIEKGVGAAPIYPFYEYEKDNYLLSMTIQHNSGLTFAIYNSNKSNTEARHYLAYAYTQNGNNYEYYKIRFDLFAENVDFSVNDYITSLVKVLKNN